MQEPVSLARYISRDHARRSSDAVEEGFRAATDCTKKNVLFRDKNDSHALEFLRSRFCRNLEKLQLIPVFWNARAGMKVLPVPRTAQTQFDICHALTLMARVK